jgi:hypothetical protein
MLGLHQRWPPEVGVPSLEQILASFGSQEPLFVDIAPIDVRALAECSKPVFGQNGGHILLV